MIDRQGARWRTAHRVRRLTTLAVTALLVVALAPYLATRFYRFGDATPFNGTHWFNPYAALDGPAEHWRKANFHAHSHAWGGVTDGHHSPADVTRAYRALGYDVAALSNYWAAARPMPTDTTTVSVYEHGASVIKAHRLVFRAPRTFWFDFPLWQSVHQQQTIIDRLRGDGAIVALAHPALRNAVRPADAARLSGYALFEVLNHFVTSDTAWDAALTAGRPVWLLANDDSHNVDGAGETGVAWTMLHAASLHADSVLAALTSGRAYGVRGHAGRSDLALERVLVRDDSLVIVHRGAAAHVRVIADSGRLVAAQRSTGTIVVALPPWAHYARVVLASETSALWLNPVVRWDGRALPLVLTTVDGRRTAAFRALAAIVVAAWLLGRRAGAARAPRPVPVTDRVGV